MTTFFDGRPQGGLRLTGRPQRKPTLQRGSAWQAAVAPCCSYWSVGTGVTSTYIKCEAAAPHSPHRPATQQGATLACVGVAKLGVAGLALHGAGEGRRGAAVPRGAKVVAPEASGDKRGREEG